jgi:hypothetical protein
MTTGAADAARATDSQGPGGPNVPYAFGLIEPDEDVIRNRWTCTPPAGGEPLKWRGPCVVCTHQHTVEVPDTVVEGALLQDAAIASVQVRLFPCLCPNPHMGRPEGTRAGCGRYWLGRVAHDADDDTYILSVETDLGLLPQAQALDEAQRSDAERARTQAEKWVGGLTALLGLLSVSGIVTGANAPKAVRADLRWLVFAAAMLALASAAAALVFAYRAAFGSPRNAPVRNQREQNRWYQRLRSTGPRAVRQLKTSILLTLVSLLFAFAVAGLLWFLPREKAPAQCTVQGHGSCQVAGQSLQWSNSADGWGAAW